MPEVLADADAEADSEPRINRRDPAARGKETPLIEQPVIGQVRLPIDMAKLGTLEQGSGDVELVIVRFLDEADDHRHLAGGAAEFRETRIVRTHRDLGVEVLEQVAGQAELGKDEQVDRLITSIRDDA